MDIKNYCEDHEPDELFTAAYKEKYGSIKDFAEAIGLTDHDAVSRSKPVMKQGFHDLGITLIKTEILLNVIEGKDKTIREKDQVIDSLVKEMAERLSKCNAQK